ncbi:hypothetical protein PW52_16770 [Tamlana sedimentorum]|uniref:DUF3575 domain-containing protein n=1 Tax=Neotamlana sedimentorum TaxID=1435349 RepID=A0A0D7VWD6_9FLAO|nr:hypothetical protein [Tamlana sedimentorum]KJD31195.1 hypothetical protein PW52_16770 [Tamlana sedimentorum]
MVVRKILLCCVLVLNFSKIYAQEKEKSWIGLETDPISSAFGAKTLSVVIEPQKSHHWSLFLNVVNADFPNWMDDFLNPKNKGKGFDSKINIGGGFAIDYFIKEERKGVYLGLINLFFQNEISRNTVSGKVLTHNIIPRVGYRWYPFKKAKLYVNPFLGLRYEYSFQNTLMIDGAVFTPAGIQPFGTIHIGYHF